VNEAVLITGASTGIGEATARRLAGNGFRVFAGVRKEADAGRLRSAGVAPLTIDIVDPGSIAVAASLVKDELGDRGLAGLVNNAGATLPGPVEFISLDELRQQFEVNTFGHVAVTQAFMPMLRQATGRIVFVGSVGGRTALPFIGPYAGSKAAIASMAVALRQELAPWGIQVSVVEPGTVVTPIWDKGDESVKRAVESLPPEGQERYGRSMEKANETVLKLARRGIKPDRVARVIESALTSRRPRTRYLVGDAWVQYLASRLLPDRVFDRVVARQLGIPRD
jgi:NAD(P)-dependent dehydrogenase (short-subunit alcohol dehydrogenase family)